MSHLEAIKYGHTETLFYETHLQNSWRSTVYCDLIDATQLKIDVPSALQKHSESYSTYKSHTTLKCLLSVDPKGRIMFISQLYEGSISDKQIVQTSGFPDILHKKSNGLLNK